MEDDDFTFDDIILSTSTTMDNTSTYTVNISDYTTTDTVDLSDITVSTLTGDMFETSRDPKRTVLRESGDIPVDIWAKLYNNRVLDVKEDDE